MGLSQHENLPYYVLVLFFLILSCFLTYGVAVDTIRANESLRGSEALISSGNRFKLSFFSPPNSTHSYVGIMYNLPVMTVVWVANRDRPLNDSSGTFQISSDGNIVILDGRKEIVWSTNLSSAVPNPRAVLLDTGNLVLQEDSNSGYLWESFQHASDSFLEKMRLFVDLSKNEKNILTSWRSPDDPAPGSSVMTIEPDIPQSYVLKDGMPYYRNGPWNGQRFIGLPGMRSLYNDGTSVGSDSPGTAYYMYNLPNSSVLLYYFLNSSGSIEKKVWSHEKKEWDVTWSSTSNDCDVYGKCGSFGSCNPQERPICSCFLGFVPEKKDEWEARNWSSGCTRRTPLQCEHNGSVGKQDDFLLVEGVKLPDHFIALSEGDCRGSCLSNCSCLAYAEPSGIGCMHWTLNVTDSQKFTYGGEDLFIRLAYSELRNYAAHLFILICSSSSFP